MYAFDLPAHGKSFPYQNYMPGEHIFPVTTSPLLLDTFSQQAVIS